jgi:hypothetical protein
LSLFNNYFLYPSVHHLKHRFWLKCTEYFLSFFSFENVAATKIYEGFYLPCILYLLCCPYQISGAKVVIHEPRPGTSDRTIVLSGSPDETQAAQSLLQAFILNGSSWHFPSRIVKQIIRNLLIVLFYLVLVPT